MSELNGDKARFQRLRKGALRRRDRARAIYAELRRAAASQRSSDNEQTGAAPGRIRTLNPEKPDAMAR
jgi:hypothetical protein